MESLKEQRAALKALKSVMADVTWMDDKDLLRFLTARNYSIPETERMLKNHLKWLDEVDFDNAEELEVDNEVKNGFPYGLDGVTRNGLMVVHIPLGAWPIRKFLENGWKNEMNKNTRRVIAHIINSLKKSGHDRLVVIIDLKGMSYWNTMHRETLQMVQNVLRDFEQNFPERLDTAYVINAPWLLQAVWPLIKPLLRGGILERVRIFGEHDMKFQLEIEERLLQVPSGLRVIG